MKALFVLAIVACAGCATVPPPRGDALPVYNPTKPIVYPLPR